MKCYGMSAKLGHARSVNIEMTVAFTRSDRIEKSFTLLKSPNYDL